MMQQTMKSQYHINTYPIENATDRFYIRSNVFLPNGEIDFQTGMVRESRPRVGRTQALRQEAHQLDHEYARLRELYKTRSVEKESRISLRAALSVMIASILIFSVILLVQQGNIIAKTQDIETLDAENISTQETIAALNEEIDEASDEVTICYAAARDLDMVPADSAEAIYLSALDTRPDNQDNDVSLVAKND